MKKEKKPDHSKKNNNKSKAKDKGKGKGKKKFTVPVPPHATFEPIEGVTIGVEFTNGKKENIGFNKPGSVAGLSFADLNWDPRKRPIKMTVQVDENHPSFRRSSAKSSPNKVIVFTKDRQKKVHVMLSSLNEDETGFTQKYSHDVRITYREPKGKQTHGRFSVDTSTNNFYVAVLTPQGMKIYAVALVRQDNRYWVEAQISYDCEAYSMGDDDMTVVYPRLLAEHGGMKDFAELDAVFGYCQKLHPSEKASFKLLDSYPGHDLSSEGLKNGQAIVNIFSIRNGVGGLIMPNGEHVRVYFADIVGDFPRALQTGEIVSVKKLTPIPNEEIKRTRTKFRYQARGVKRL